MQKENMLSGHCDMDSGDSTYYPPFPQKDHIVVKVIVIFQHSTHHHLKTTSKDVKSVMLSYFLFITSHFFTLFITI